MDKAKLMQTRRYLRSSLTWLREVRDESDKYSIALDEGIRNLNVVLDWIEECIEACEQEEE